MLTLIPLEIRNVIYTYALTDTTSYPVDRDCPEDANPFARFDRFGSIRSRGGVHLYPSDIAFPLLRTCKAIYLETYGTTLRINSFIVGELSGQMGKYKFSTWQLAQIRSLDFTLPQAALENGALRNALEEWKANARHGGAYLVPLGVLHGGSAILGEYKFPRTFNNTCLVPAVSEMTKNGPERLVEVANRLGMPQDKVFPCARDIRVVRAQPIAHLTLRLMHTDWWTWGNSPSDDPIRQLHLDPTFGLYPDGRPSNKHMRFRASERLAGRHPRLDPQCWGSHICSLLPDLKTLELVLETWKVKEKQLETVVQCAKTWRFCDEGGWEGKERWALVWDSEVVEKRWSRGLRGLRLPKDASWADRCNGFEVRVVRYVRRRVEG